jgi:hypothetical protein
MVFLSKPKKLCEIKIREKARRGKDLTYRYGEVITEFLLGVMHTMRL